MSDSYIKAFLEFLKLAPRYLVSLAIVAAFLLFSPDNLLKWLRLYDFAQSYRQWLALGFIITSVLFIVDRTIAVASGVRNKMAKAKATKRRLQRLNSLTEDEKQILRFYFVKQTKTNVLRVDDGVVKGLVAEGIIYQSAAIGSFVEGFAHNITDFAWEYLNEHIDLLNGTTRAYRTDKLHW